MVNSELVKDNIRNLDSVFYNQKREVITFTDNSTAHGEISNLKVNELFSLQTYTTNKLRSLDKGIFKSLMDAYRIHLVQKAINDIEKRVELKINDLDAIRLI